MPTTKTKEPWTRLLMSVLLVAFLASLTFDDACAQSTGSADARVLVDVELTEGTNMAAALSPDGSTLLLALQGVLWALPPEGGVAEPLTAPEMDAQEPAWSPHGDRVTFYAFAENGFSVWVMRPDGSDLRRVSEPGGDARYPTFSPDGRAVLYSDDRDGGYSIKSVDLDSGERRILIPSASTGHSEPTTPFFSGTGNALYPTLSPDGTTLAFVIDGPDDTLVVWDVNNGQDLSELYSASTLGAPLWAPAGDALYMVGLAGQSSHLARVPVDGSSVELLVDGGDVFPFRPSPRADQGLIYTADGGVHALSFEGGAAQTVSFSATVTLDRTPYERRTYDFSDQTPRPALGIIDPVLSPDGTEVAFTALGDLWIADVDSGNPRQLTDDIYLALSPSWSPDGNNIAFVSDREGKSDIWLMNLENETTTRVSDSPLVPSSPIWSPDGERIAYLTEEDGRGVFVSASVNVFEIATGASTTISNPIFGPSAPAWSPDGDWIAIYHRRPVNSRFREGVNQIYLLPASGEGEAKWVTPIEGQSLGRRQFNRPAWSSSGELVVRVDGELWSVAVGTDGAVADAVRIADSGENPSWSADGSRLVYLDGADLKLYDVADGTHRTLDLKPEWAHALSDEAFTLRIGRLFDGTANGYQEDVDLVIERGVITAIRPAGSSAPEGDLIDASDKFVIPGLIEAHTHQSTSQGIALGELWLAHGITAVRETGADPYFAVERREATASGRRPGPRVFTSGPLNEGARVSYGVSETVGTSRLAEGAARLSDALELDMYKSYVRQDYTVQKYAISLAHASGTPVSSHELYPAVAHGIDMMEHFGATSRRGYSLKMSRLNNSYQDVISLINESGVVVIPTLALSDRFGARDISAQKTMLMRIVEGGGNIIAGTDSPFVAHAAALHRELEIYVEAGLTPAHALRTATSYSAHAIGAGDQIGTLAPGYIADLVILEEDPLEDIRNVQMVHTVFKSGLRVYPN